MFLSHHTSLPPSSGNSGLTSFWGNLPPHNSGQTFRKRLSPTRGGGARDVGISQSANCRPAATISGSGINTSANQNEEDTVRLLWGFLGGKQILLLLGLDVQEDSAGNIVILALWEESLPENRAKIQDVTPRERKKKKIGVLITSDS